MKDRQEKMNDTLTLEEWENRMSDALSRFKMLFVNRQLDIPYNYFRSLSGISRHFTRKNVCDYFSKLQGPSVCWMMFHALNGFRHGNIDMCRPEQLLSWRAYCQRYFIPVRLMDVLYSAPWRFLAERVSNDVGFAESDYMLSILKALVAIDDNPTNAVARIILWERLCVSTHPRENLPFIQNVVAYVVFWYINRPKDNLHMCRYQERDNAPAALYALFFADLEHGVPYSVCLTESFLRSIDVVSSVGTDGIRVLTGTHSTIAKAMEIMIPRPPIRAIDTPPAPKPSTPAKATEPPKASRQPSSNDTPVVPEDDIMELLAGPTPNKRIKTET